MTDKGPTRGQSRRSNAGTLRVRGAGAEDRRAAGRCHHHHQRRRPGRRRQQGTPAGPPVAFQGRRGTAPLPAGRYVVRVEQGLVRAERTVVVPAGSQGRVDIPAQRRAAAAVGGRPRGARPRRAPVFSVVEDDPDAPRGRREIARSAARQAEFVLPPGTYYVIARQGTSRRASAWRSARATWCGGRWRSPPAVSRWRPGRAGGARRRRASRSPTASSASTAAAERDHHQPRRARPCCCRPGAIASKAATA